MILNFLKNINKEMYNTVYIEPCSHQGSTTDKVLSNPQSNDDLEIFNALYNLVNTLYDNFGNIDKKLSLYYFILSETKISNFTDIKYHVDKLYNFLADNIEYIDDKTHENIGKLIFNENAEIDFNYLFRHLEEQNKEILFRHISLLTKLCFDKY